MNVIGHSSRKPSFQDCHSTSLTGENTVMEVNLDLGNTTQGLDKSLGLDSTISLEILK